MTKEYISSDMFCDGTSGLGNAAKNADCGDNSDEIFVICCEDSYPAYTTEICGAYF